MTKQILSLAGLVVGMAISTPSAARALDYEKDILPILKESCFECHSNEAGKTKGNLVLDDIEEVKDYQIGKYNIIRPENPEESQFLDLIKLPAGDSDAMPPDGKRMSPENVKLIEQWIAEGALIDGVARTLDGEEKPVGEVGKGGMSKEKDSGSGGLGDDKEPEYLNWTNAEGKDIEARFVRLSGDKVVLLMRDGKSYPYPLEKLSQASRDLAEKLGGVEK